MTTPKLLFSCRDGSLASLARKHGLDPATVHCRIKYLGWSRERALSTPIRGGSGGKKNPASIRQQAIRAGLNPETVRKHVSQGMTLSEALARVPCPNSS